MDDDSVNMRRLRRDDPAAYLGARLGERGTNRLVQASDAGVPLATLVVAARWWQLESYLRQLLYLTLTAEHGHEWEAALPRQARNRAEKAVELGYMASADDDYPLAHLDVTPLFELIDALWDRTKSGIGLPQAVWAGRIAELKPVRHRLAHCRRPHSDDVDRIEQLLRDLEPAAHRTLWSYCNWQEPSRNLADPIVDAWVHRHHPAASRLVEHGERNKGIHFTLTASALPWAEDLPVITGSKGWFWVMRVYLVERHLYIEDYCTELAVRAALPVIGHIVQSDPGSIAVTIPAAQDADLIADTLGNLLDSAFTESRPGDVDGLRHPWKSVSTAEDPRIDVGGVLSVLSGIDRDDPISLFEARS